MHFRSSEANYFFSLAIYIEKVMAKIRNSDDVNDKELVDLKKFFMEMIAKNKIEIESEIDKVLKQKYKKGLNFEEIL